MLGNMISHYKILKKLGEGGMGEVYLAEDTALDRKVALKFLTPQPMQEETRLRFKREAQAAAALNHPNIITVYEIGEYENHSYIAMEYVEGRSLQDLIDHARDAAHCVCAPAKAEQEDFVTRGVVLNDIAVAIHDVLFDATAGCTAHYLIVVGTDPPVVEYVLGYFIL